MTEPDQAPTVDLGAPRTIHLVGVGGSGISAVAVVLAAMGHRVSGADVRPTPAWPTLERAGVALDVVAPGELFASAERHGAEVVAHSTAFRPSPADQDHARAAGRQVIDRAAILGAICRARSTIAVSGTHGKTSTTAMLATLLDGVGADPSFLVGAVPVGLGQAARWGGAAGVFAVEADESDGSFLALGAATAVVTNIDEDHLDHWGTIDAIEQAFDSFVAQAATSIVGIDDPRGGSDPDPRALRVAARHGSITVGESAGAHYRIHGVTVDRLHTTFGLVAAGVEVGPVSIATPGRHHARNAATALAAAATIGVDLADGVAALAAYQGVARRFEVVGEAGGVVVVDDYAHNPGKVRALVSSAREAGWERLVVIFQPHRYSRTRDQGADLGAALVDADVVAVTDVYGAGEEAVAGVTGKLVLDALLDARPRTEAAWLPTTDDVLAWADGALGPGDLCLTVGAGDVSELGPRLLARLAARAPAIAR